MSQLIVGVDAGGSRTVAALAREDVVIQIAAGESANASVVGCERASGAIAASILSVLEGETAAAIAVGAAGAGSEPVRAALLAALQARFPATRILVTDDACIALRAAVPQGDGAVLVAGTGAIAHSEIAGRSFRAGGYGYLFGDPGSGYAIGAAALRLLLDAGGNVANDPLLCDLAVHVGSHERAEILARVYGSAAPVANIAACAPVVLRYANQDEPRADAIARDAAQALFDLAQSIARRSKANSLPLVFAGGLLRERNALRDLLEVRIGIELPNLRVTAGKEPYLGALAQARQLLQTA